MAKINIRDRNKNNPTKKANWEYRFEIAKIGGKRQSYSKAGFATKKEALSAGAIALAEYENSGKVFSPSEISVADFLNYWLENYAEVNLADSTVVAYKNIVKTHVIPRIGAYKMKSIDTLTLQEMINDIYISHGFSRAFLLNIIKVLKGSFKYAQLTANYIQTNPALNVALPKGLGNPNKKSSYISKEDFERLLERFKNSPYQYYALLISYFTGLRVSEVYGLTWDCIDLENKKLTVNKIVKKIDGFDGNRKLKRTPGGIRGKAHTKWYLGDCKTSSSYRKISISEYLANELKEYKSMQEKNEAEYGDLYTKHYLKEELTKSQRKVYRIISMDESAGFEVPLPRAYLVMVKENGEFHGTDSMKYPSKVAKYELGIDFRFHSLRHTHGTMLYENGAPVKDIQDRLGHASFAITMDTYVENTDKMKEATARIIDENIKIDIDKTPTNQRLHGIWLSLVNRCKSNPFYTKNQISLCDEWQEYKPFEAWAMANGYADELYLSRIEKTENYTPDNCQWVTLHEVKSAHS